MTFNEISLTFKSGIPVTTRITDIMTTQLHISHGHWPIQSIKYSKLKPSDQIKKIAMTNENLGYLSLHSSSLPPSSYGLLGRKALNPSFVCTIYLLISPQSYTYQSEEPENSDSASAIGSEISSKFSDTTAPPIVSGSSDARPCMP
jgi:hypothetical protein